MNFKKYNFIFVFMVALVIAIPIVSSDGWRGTFKTKYPINGVIKRTKTMPIIKCYMPASHENIQPSTSSPPSPN